MPLPGRPGLRIRSSWQRPGELLLRSFGQAASSQIADVMGRLGAMDSGIKPMWSSPRIIGAALTVWCHSADNLMLHKAIAMAQPGDILVVNTQNNVTNSPFGELLATSARAMDISGVIVDGTVRDGSSFEKLPMAVYARALCPNGCNRDGGGEIGATIACGGVAVRPGDVLVADRDGVAVVPLEDAAEVAAAAVAKLRQEEERLREIHAGVVLRSEVDEHLRRLKVIA